MTISFFSCGISSKEKANIEKAKNIADSLRMDSIAREIKTTIENAITEASSDTLGASDDESLNH